MIPTIDLSTVLKLAARAVVRTVIKSSIGMVIFLCSLVAGVVTLLYNTFLPSFFPELASLLSFDFGWIVSNFPFVGVLLYALDFATLWGLVQWCWGWIDDLIVFTITFSLACFAAMMAYKWSSAFKNDMEKLFLGL